MNRMLEQTRTAKERGSVIVNLRHRCCAESDPYCFAFRPGTGKQIIKKGIQRKIRSSRVTMIKSRIRAQMVMIGIESEQIIPKPAPPEPQGVMSSMERS